MFSYARRKLYELWYKLVTLKSSPRKIALGFALGIFIAYTPPLFYQVALAVALAAVFRVNPVAAVLGTYLTNVLTTWPLFILCYDVGRLLVGGPPLASSAKEIIDHIGFSWASVKEIAKLGVEAIAVETVGAVIVGAVSAPIAYFLCLYAVVKYRTARLNRRIKKMRERIQQAKTPAPQQPGAVQAAPPSEEMGKQQGN